MAPKTWTGETDAPAPKKPADSKKTESKADTPQDPK